MRIGEVAQRAGLRTSAIRYYEAAGVLPVPERAGGRRTYDESVLSRLAVIRFAQAGAFTLDEIKELFSEHAGERPISARWKRLATAKLIELDSVIARAEAMKRELREALRCGCVEVEQCGRMLLRDRKVAGSLQRARLQRRKLADR
jgi:MerR family redox-sensitive transcriptional activator SoxR